MRKSEKNKKKQEKLGDGRKLKGEKMKFGIKKRREIQEQKRGVGDKERR